MKNFSLHCYLWLLALLVTPLGALHAELPPGAYEELKQEAKEVLNLKIEKVTRVRGDDQIYYHCQAKVNQVERSAHGYKKGDVVTFETWLLSADAKKNFAGPAVPPKLPVGWSGKVFLNPPESDPDAKDAEDADVLQLAAYGRSFEPDKKKRRRRKRQQK